jgi:ABC-type amino acid transport substrate-binding protein
VGLINNVPIGFSVDLFRAIAKQMGINFEFRIGSWNEILTAIGV